jgi:Tfp pilus assembly protein PilV
MQSINDDFIVIIGVLIGLVAVLIVAVSVTILLIVIKRFKQKKKQNLSQSKEQQWQQSTDNTQIGGRDIINMKELSSNFVTYFTFFLVCCYLMIAMISHSKSHS